MGVHVRAQKRNSALGLILSFRAFAHVRPNTKRAVIEFAPCRAAAVVVVAEAAAEIQIGEVCLTRGGHTDGKYGVNAGTCGFSDTLKFTHDGVCRCVCLCAGDCLLWAALTYVVGTCA